MGVRRLVTWLILLGLAFATLTACGTESGGTSARPFAASPTAAPSPTTSYACGEGPPRHATVTAVSGNGASRWKRDLPDPTDTDGQVRPVVNEDTVFVMSSGTVLALAAGDGKVRWSTAVGKTGYGLWLTGDTLVASTDQVGADAAITGLNVQSGKVDWTYRPGGNGLLGDQLPTSDAGLAMVDSAGHTLVVDMNDGTVRWSNPGRVQAYGLGVAGDVVLRDAGGLLTAYDPAGKVRWHRSSVDPAGLNTLGGMVVVTGAAVGPSIDGSAVAYDAQTGHQLWRASAASALGWGGGGPAGIALYSQDGGRPFLLVVDPATGKQRWRVSTQIGLFLPALVRGHTLTTVEGGTAIQKDVELVRRDVGTGKVLSKVTLSASPTSGPIALSASRTAVAILQPTPPHQQSTVAAYDDGAKAWSVEVSSFVRWVAPAPGSGAYVQTLDPSYGCALDGRRAKS